MSREEQTMFKLIQSKAREVMPPGVKVYLYGSRARGDHHQGSDWDILILLDKPRVEMSDYDELSYPLTELGWVYGQDIIPVIYAQDEWDHPASLLFRRNVEQDAIALV